MMTAQNARFGFTAKAQHVRSQQVTLMFQRITVAKDNPCLFQAVWELAVGYWLVVRKLWI
jgi:hypothetical protein